MGKGIGLQVTGYKFQVTGYRFQVAEYLETGNQVNEKENSQRYPVAG